MKKTPAKLQLKSSTLRLLQANELLEVRGGGGGGGERMLAPSNHPTVCSATRDC
jgi:hypothetical protein